MFEFDAATLFYAVVAIFVCLLVVLLYVFIVKPKRKLVFSEEEDLGPWTVPLARLGWTAEGNVCTARQHYEALFSQLVTNTPEKTERSRLIKCREHVFKAYMYAMRSQSGNLLLLFDENPLDPKFHTAMSNHRFINPVQDCKSGGVDESKIEIISVKLSMETASFTSEEMADSGQREEALKFIKVAATNIEKIAHLEEARANDRLVVEQLYRDNRKLSTERDTATVAAQQVPLATPGVVPVKPSIFGAIGRKLFSREQIIVGIISFIAWIAVTNILKGFSVFVPDPNTVAILVAAAIFFGVPIMRGWRNK